MKFALATSVCLLWWSAGYGQLINNHSIEGPNRPNRSPSFWYPCSPESTPDTQPLAYGVNLAAYDGQTYLGLVTRKLSFEPFEVKEDVETRLNLPLIARLPYLLNISLAYAPTMKYYDDGATVEVKNPVKLRIYGGTESCDRTELLWESPVADFEDWEQFEVVIQTQTNGLRYVILEAFPAGNQFENGNILIDDINLREEPVIIPTAFTPNGDGKNDLFHIKGLRPESQLEIVTRDGKKVLSTDNYDNAWNGDSLPAGVYYYTLTSTIKPQQWKGEISLMR